MIVVGFAVPIGFEGETESLVFGPDPASVTAFEDAINEQTTTADLS